MTACEESVSGCSRTLAARADGAEGACRQGGAGPNRSYLIPLLGGVSGRPACLFQAVTFLSLQHSLVAPT